MTKILFLTAFIGHVICWHCDWIITYTPNGRFQLKDISNNESMSALFDGMPAERPMRSILWGTLALFMSFLGYLGLYEWMKQFSLIYAALIMIPAAAFLIPGMAHHAFCGVIEWFYIKLGRTAEARELVLDFFKKTSIAMYVCYIGMLIASISFLIAVVSGQTSLPRWECIFNVLPLFLILLPFRIVGTGNIAHALMFLGLFLTV